MIWVGVALLGGCASVARLLLGRAVEARTFLAQPGLGTFVINTLGCVAAGLSVGLGHDAHLLVAGGLIGSFTTFSTWIVEAERGGARHAALVLGAGLAAGLLAAGLTS